MIVLSGLCAVQRASREERRESASISNRPDQRAFALCVITFEPIKIQTHSAPQNDRLNFSFVKDVYVDGKKWLEMVEKRQNANEA